MIVEFLSDETTINGVVYKKGDTVSVSSSIAQRLLESKEAQEFVESKKTKTHAKQPTENE